MSDRRGAIDLVESALLFFVLFFFDDAPVPACVARGLARFRFRPAAVPAALLALPVSIGSGGDPFPRRDSNPIAQQPRARMKL